MPTPKKQHIHYRPALIINDSLILHGYRLGGDYIPVIVAKVRVRLNSAMHLALVDGCPVYDCTRN